MNKNVIALHGQCHAWAALGVFPCLPWNTQDFDGKKIASIWPSPTSRKPGTTEPGHRTHVLAGRVVASQVADSQHARDAHDAPGLDLDLPTPPHDRRRRCSPEQQAMAPRPPRRRRPGPVPRRPAPQPLLPSAPPHPHPSVPEQRRRRRVVLLVVAYIQCGKRLQKQGKRMNHPHRIRQQLHLVLFNLFQKGKRKIIM